MKIWIRHLFYQLISSFLFFLICLVVVYIVIDFSANGVRFLNKSSWKEISVYYSYTFSTLLDFFFSLAFLLATMRVLITLTARREILALQMAGLSKKRLLIPFFAFATFLSFLCYANSQWVAPFAQNTVGTFKLSNKRRAPKPLKIYSIPLENGTEIVYQRYDKEQKELFDVFWVKSPDDIWHMKSLELTSLLGHYVHHLTRADHNWEKKESFSSYYFSDLPWKEENIFHSFIPFENRSLSTLAFQLYTRPLEKPALLSHFLYKIFVPLIPFLILFATAPICLYFSRNRPLFITVALSIFALLSLKIILDGMLILGETQALPATVAILGPLFLLFVCFFPRFLAMK